MENEVILDVKNLTVLVNEGFLVKDVSFSMSKGECLGIVGEDKSGKTSLIKTLTGGLAISDGSVTLFGKDIVKEPKVLESVGLCLDPPVFFKYQTVMNNFEYLCSLSGKVDKQRILVALNKFNLAHKMKKHVFFLSYYERKLMTLALAYIKRPKLMIFDEPFKGLPLTSVQDMRDYIQELRDNGTDVIISSKDYSPIEDICSKFVFMENRKVKSVLTNKECRKYSTENTFAFIQVKYPHYCGKLVMENFGIDVKILGKRILFEADEDLTADIVRYFTKNRISVHKAGYLNKKSERIFANLTPYFKEENN